MEASVRFNDSDIYYLANSFNRVQLRVEIHRAEIREAMAKTFRETIYQGDRDLWPWTDYATACREAIEWQRQSTPKQTPTTGHIDTEAIKATSDIVAVVERYTKLHKSGKHFTGRCCLHPDKNPSLTIYPDQQTWHCFGCQKGGDVFDFIMAAESVNFRRSVVILGGV